MLYYPQLASGSIAQFPMSRHTTIRTVVNQLMSGYIISMGDPGSAMVRWQLQYSTLTDNEWASIEQLFETAVGKLNTFVFLDPMDNLLMWSEDWTQAVWKADPMLQITGGAPDPLGGDNAMQIANTGQATQRVVQATAGPSGFEYCFSVYVRGDAPGTIQLVASSNGQDSLTAVAISSEWQRVFFSPGIAAEADGISFGVQLAPGIAISAFGAQAEAQPSAGAYKKNIDHGGVYPATRFDSDSLLRTSTGINHNSATINLISAL